MTNNTHRAIYPQQAPAYYNDWQFSPAVQCNGFLFVSGCTGTLDDGTVPDGILAQTKQAFIRIKSCLMEANLGFSDIVDMTTYHVGLQRHLNDFIRAKSEFIEQPYPAWTAIGVSELASPGALIEIKVVATSCKVS